MKVNLRIVSNTLHLSSCKKSPRHCFCGLSGVLAAVASALNMDYLYLPRHWWVPRRSTAMGKIKCQLPFAKYNNQKKSRYKDTVPFNEIQTITRNNFLTPMLQSAPWGSQGCRAPSLARPMSPPLSLARQLPKGCCLWDPMGAVWLLKAQRPPRFGPILGTEE